MVVTNKQDNMIVTKKSKMIEILSLNRFFPNYDILRIMLTCVGSPVCDSNHAQDDPWKTMETMEFRQNQRNSMGHFASE